MKNKKYSEEELNHIVLMKIQDLQDKVKRYKEKHGEIPKSNNETQTNPKEKNEI